MPWVRAVLAVPVGGAAGAVLRHLVSMPPLGPFRGVPLANVAGSAGGRRTPRSPEQEQTWREPVRNRHQRTEGTTWSTLAVQGVGGGRRDLRRATAYLCLTLILGLAAGAGSFSLLTRTGGV